MSIWTTKSLDRDRNYIVIQHTLKGVNYVINGVKFREGYAVVEKDSKVYNSLKKVSVLRASKEYPLTHLAKLPFITRTNDIQTVYGKDVFRRYLEEVEKESESQALAKKLEQELLDKLSNDKREEELKLKAQIEEVIKKAIESGESQEVIDELKESIPEITKCCYKMDNGNLCGANALDYSKAGYCNKHIFEDPILVEYGLELKKFTTKDEKKALREKIRKTLTTAKRQGKF